MKITVIIPARGGSKGIPRKNIKKLNGKPLIYYSIEEARKSKYLDRIIVSTDDEEIADIARKYGAEVPFVRPKELAQDDTPGILPIIHTIEWLRDKEGYEADYVVNLQPTSPLRTCDDIDKAINKLVKSNLNYLVSVCKATQHPLWMRKIEEDKLIPFINSITALRRQELPEVYVLNGALEVFRTNILLKKPYMENEATLSYIMPKEKSIDIDDLYDFKIAELIIKERNIYDKNK